VSVCGMENFIEFTNEEEIKDLAMRKKLKT
jgi:hypothetical protein